MRLPGPCGQNPPGSRPGVVAARQRRYSRPPACCGRKKSAACQGPEQEAFIHSRGGSSTKIHVSVSGSGPPVEIRLTPGQEADVKQAETLLEGYSPEAVIADKAYDSDLWSIFHTAYQYYTIRSELALRAAPESGHNSMCQNSIKTLLRAMKRALKNETPRPAPAESPRTSRRRDHARRRLSSFAGQSFRLESLTYGP